MSTAFPSSEEQTIGLTKLEYTALALMAADIIAEGAVWSQDREACSTNEQLCDTAIVRAKMLLEKLEQQK